ncbi:MAG: PTS sugar transporter subunit IIA [Candidatus Hydrogenedentota bacterium]|nr:MAG: PTS sugar transporter subunit IIA [Candidatus Hydrogenedentota bacterium]
MNFGYILRTLRICAGVGLRELSRTIDVSPTYLSLVENGKQPPPSAIRIAQIEEALEVPPGYLLSITSGFNPDVTLFVQQVPEAVDFLNLARESSMSSADFMELTGFLNLYGWESMKQALERNGLEGVKSFPETPDKAIIGSYVWPFLDEGLIIDIVGVSEKGSFLKEAVGQIADQFDGVKPEVILRELLERENIASTGIGNGVAVPHAYVPGLDRMIVAFLRMPEGVDFDAIDGELVYMALLLAGPRSAENLHLKLLARIAKLVSHKSFCEGLLAATSPRSIISRFRSAEMRIP